MKIDQDNNDGLGKTIQLTRSDEYWAVFKDSETKYHINEIKLTGLTDLGYVVHYMHDQEGGHVTAESCANLYGFYTLRVLRNHFTCGNDGTWTKKTCQS